MFSRRHRAVARYLGEEAERRGVPIDEVASSLTMEEMVDIVDRATPGRDLSRWGLVPRAELTEWRRSGVTEIDDAAAAARGGEWTPAADLMGGSYGEWEHRAAAVILLAEAAAHDDGWLTAWRAARPDDRHVAPVDCEGLTVLAWQLRGGARAADTSADQFARFHRVLARAEAAAKAATETLPGDPTPWATLATIARGLSYDHTAFDRVWQGIVERAPLHRHGHVTALQYWCAKWRGSEERMWAFADEAAGKSPSLAVLVLQAAFESDREKVWRQSNVREALDVLLRWLESDGADSVHVLDDLGWAASALVNTDRAAEAVPLFRRLGGYAGGAPWRLTSKPTYFFNECRIKACKAAGNSFTATGR
jgi:hypothetical protein